MKPRHILVAAIFAAVPLSGALADGYGPAGSAPAGVPHGDTLHVGPGNNYEVLATIRPGTSPNLRFCQYHGRWCYGSYGRWNGWFYGGENSSDRWTLRYLLGR